MSERAVIDRAWEPHPAAVAAAERHGAVLGPDAPIMEVMATMRAMRRLKPDPVPRELLERIVEAASWAPSGGNLQSYGYVIVDDRETMRRCGDIWRRQQRFYSAAQEPLPPEHTTQEKWSRVHDALRHQAAHFDETPAFIAFTYSFTGPILGKMIRGIRHTLRGCAQIGVGGTLRMLPNLPRFLSTAETSSVYPGVENALLAARAYGLAACLTTWHTMYEPDWRRALGLPRGTKIFAIVPIGWPEGHFGPVVRRPVSELITYTGT